MIRPFPALVAAFLVVLCACGGKSTPANPTPSPSASTTSLATDPQGCLPARFHAAGDSTESVNVGGASRAYVLHIPPGYAGTVPSPVVLAFHPFGSAAAPFLDYAGAGALADQRDFVVAAPQGAGSPQGWNTNKDATQPDDVAFASGLLQQLSTELCLDPDRVYAMGFAEGGAMAVRLACDLPDQIAAIGAVAATYVQCTGNVPIVAFHGMADPAVRFDGGPIPPEQGGGSSPPVRRTLSEWAKGLGCDGLPLISRPSTEIELSTFERCLRGDGEALLYTVLGGGHTWPGAKDVPGDAAGVTTHQLDATTTIWEFFVAHTLAH